MTDSTCDLPSELCSDLDITVVPLTVHFGKEGFKDGSPNCNQLRTGSGLQAEQNVKGEAGPAVSELPNMQSYPVLLSIFCNHRRSVNLIIGRDMNVIHPPC